MKMIKQTKIETKKQKNLLLSILCFCLALFISGCGDEKTTNSSLSERSKPSKSQSAADEETTSSSLFGSGSGSQEKATPKQKKYEPEANFVVQNRGSECTIIGYKGESMELNIPPEIGGRIVTVIGGSINMNNISRKGAFEDCQEIVKVVIPDTVRIIENSAFYGCIYLESVNIPKNVRLIAPRAFWHCKSLKDIKVPENCTLSIDPVFDSLPFDKNCKIIRY